MAGQSSQITMSIPLSHTRANKTPHFLFSNAPLPYMVHCLNRYIRKNGYVKQKRRTNHGQRTKHRVHFFYKAIFRKRAKPSSNRFQTDICYSFFNGYAHMNHPDALFFPIQATRMAGNVKNKVAPSSILANATRKITFYIKWQSFRNTFLLTYP